jgi:hypothetical protein
MSKRTKQQQTKHDKRIAVLARKYKRGGAQVKADIKGYKQPKPIGKGRRIPDLTVKKSGWTKIIEVETKNSLKKDKKQHATFRRSASHKKRTKFEIDVI